MIWISSLTMIIVLLCVIIIFEVSNLNYKNIQKGTFISRPNRFIAYCKINEKEEICHVKNTGRCKELLIRGCEVYLEKSDKISRKTKYDIIAVNKSGILINMDSQAPNKAVLEWLNSQKPFGDDMEAYAEQTYGKSRFDFLLKSNKTDRKIYLEVKGCTLERDGIALFPDAPTARGVKHVNELMTCIENGMEGAILILVQMSGVKYFTPNYETHKEFGEALKKAKEKGAAILCYDSIVTPDSIKVGNPVEIRL